MKAFLLSALVSSAAFGTTLIKADLGQLTRSSDAVVIGKVHAVQSRFTADGLKIVTDAEIQVSQTLKGQVEGTIVVMQPGGEVGEVGQRVAGTARFARGEEVAVFLERRGPRFFVTGMVQGKFKVEKSPDGKTWVVPPREVDADLVDPLTRQQVSADTAPMQLEVFVQKVATAAGQTAPVTPASPKGLEKR
jgi:hypothetical protein